MMWSHSALLQTTLKSIHECSEDEKCRDWGKAGKKEDSKAARSDPSSVVPVSPSAKFSTPLSVVELSPAITATSIPFLLMSAQF
jgi:hypothetical protein